MIGKLIPAGTGMKAYRNIQVDYGEYEQFMHSAEKAEDAENAECAQNSPEKEQATVNEVDNSSTGLI